MWNALCETVLVLSLYVLVSVRLTCRRLEQEASTSKSGREGLKKCHSLLYCRLKSMRD